MSLPPLSGWRSPLLDNQAIIACVENPTAIFETGERPRIAAAVMMLDAGGNGIRALLRMDPRGAFCAEWGRSAVACEGSPISYCFA
jgi:hypothetical protein